MFNKNMSDADIALPIGIGIALLGYLIGVQALMLLGIGILIIGVWLDFR